MMQIVILDRDVHNQQWLETTSTSANPTAITAKGKHKCLDQKINGPNVWPLKIYIYIYQFNQTFPHFAIQTVGKFFRVKP